MKNRIKEYENDIEKERSLKHDLEKQLRDYKHSHES